ncbi:MAG: response regulator, partial [Campylobacterota bacterium]|nr:response regulator [Campylobacterota bacterium]
AVNCAKITLFSANLIYNQSMFDKEFLKTLTIMYVEDDETIRNSLSTILVKIFGEVIICNDGNDGINQFNYYIDERKTKIDLIISDINMPNKNGIDMIKGIREHDEDIPVIFTTAHGEANYLMEAIKLKIAYYALKPINTTELLQNISKFCMIEHNKKLVNQQKNEISKYMSIMNQITLIFKFDTSGKILEPNELLTEISEYSKNELEGLSIDNLLHKDSTVKSYTDIVKLIGDNNSYSGKIKFISKTNNSFYLNSTILPHFNDSTNEIEGYIYIGLDQTDEELEKQQTMQKVRKNIISQRSKESQQLLKIKELEEQIALLKQQTISSTDSEMIVQTLNREKQKVQTLNNQVEYYEKEIIKLKLQKDRLIENEQTKKNEILKKGKDSQRENKNLQDKVIELQAHIARLERKGKRKTVD